MGELQAELNRVAGTTGLDAQGAANVFGAFTFRPESALGTWTAPDHHRYQDRLSMLCVDVEDTPEHRGWLTRVGKP